MESSGRGCIFGIRSRSFPRYQRGRGGDVQYRTPGLCVAQTKEQVGPFGSFGPGAIAHVHSGCDKCKSSSVPRIRVELRAPARAARGCKYKTYWGPERERSWALVCSYIPPSMGTSPVIPGSAWGAERRWGDQSCIERRLHFAAFFSLYSLVRRRLERIPASPMRFPGSTQLLRPALSSAALPSPSA
jgi:hypothetical protein